MDYIENVHDMHYVNNVLNRVMDQVYASSGLFSLRKEKLDYSWYNDTNAEHTDAVIVEAGKGDRKVISIYGMHGDENAIYGLPAALNMIEASVLDRMININDFSYSAVIVNPLALLYGMRRVPVVDQELNSYWKFDGDHDKGYGRINSRLRNSIRCIVDGMIDDPDKTVLCDHHSDRRSMRGYYYLSYMSFSGEYGMFGSLEKVLGYVSEKIRRVGRLRRGNYYFGGAKYGFSFKISKKDTLMDYYVENGVDSFVLENGIMRKKRAGIVHGLTDLELIRQK